MPLLLAARIARHPHVRGSALSIGLAMVPLIVIVVVADGMIEGITSRYIELKTYHIRAYLPEQAPADEALAALRKDHEYLLRGDVFTADVIDTWIWYKTENEVDALRLRPHPYEFCLYYDM